MIFHKNKKGQGIIGGMILLFIVIIIFAIVNLFSFDILDDIKPDISTDINNSVEATKVLDDTYNNFPELFNSLIIFILAGLWVGGLISSFIADEHPMIFMFMMIAVIFTIIAGLFLSNTYQEIILDSSVSDVASQFTSQNFIISNLLPISIGIAITMLIIRFAKNRL